MKRPLALAMIAILSGCGAEQPGHAPDAGVAVSTITPRQGSMPRWLTAYGSATPSSSGTRTLSIPQPGQVAALLVTAGAHVHAGQPLVRFAVAPSALSGYEAASTTLAAALRQRDTTARLLAQQLATRDQLSQADKAVADARAALDAQRREGAGQAIQIVRAPFGGIVTALPVAAGDRPQPGAALATVAREGAMIATAGIDPSERDHVRPGQTARLTRLSGGPAIAARVLRIDGQLNPATHMIDVDLGFPAGALLPGEAVKAEIATGASMGWAVPHAAVVTDDDGAHVFQIAGGRAKAVPVAIVQTSAMQDVVQGPLDPKRPLIVEGAYQVEDGGAVRAAR
ncbi:efflux RND transporter periplasmic adaptor subunit [Sphingomonas sp. PR090111-T3T-6A]|uniref:efflux RND transporter periplasmic adaptor subunit n=1 Tax=Sphingomonas sp. PR090111-T3T-6A TaxID=685778 RepID=UPI000368DB7C|nr:efflux RND transporter periplasmic adaptor subunit [Sphingomonas sp. PR090111-T3T-6A]